MSDTTDSPRETSDSMTTPAPDISRIASAVAVCLFVFIAALLLGPLTELVLLPLLRSGQLPLGWTWPSALGLAAFSVVALVLLGGSLYRRLHTTFDDNGVQVPDLRGVLQHIPWSEFERVSGRGLQIRLHARQITVTVHVLCYTKPAEVVPYLLQRLPKPVLGDTRAAA